MQKRRKYIIVLTVVFGVICLFIYGILGLIFGVPLAMPSPCEDIETYKTVSPDNIFEAKIIVNVCGGVFGTNSLNVNISENNTSYSWSVFFATRTAGLEVEWENSDILNISHTEANIRSFKREIIMKLKDGTTKRIIGINISQRPVDDL